MSPYDLADLDWFAQNKFIGEAEKQRISQQSNPTASQTLPPTPVEHAPEVGDSITNNPIATPVPPADPDPPEDVKPKTKRKRTPKLSDHDRVSLPIQTSQELLQEFSLLEWLQRHQLEQYHDFFLMSNTTTPGALVSLPVESYGKVLRMRSIKDKRRLEAAIQTMAAAIEKHGQQLGLSASTSNTGVAETTQNRLLANMPDSQCARKSLGHMQHILSETQQTTQMTARSQPIARPKKKPRKEAIRLFCMLETLFDIAPLKSEKTDFSDSTKPFWQEVHAQAQCSPSQANTTQCAEWHFASVAADTQRPPPLWRIATKFDDDSSEIPEIFPHKCSCQLKADAMRYVQDIWQRSSAQLRALTENMCSDVQTLLRKFSEEQEKVFQAHEADMETLREATQLRFSPEEFQSIAWPLAFPKRCDVTVRVDGVDPQNAKCTASHTLTSETSTSRSTGNVLYALFDNHPTRANMPHLFANEMRTTFSFDPVQAVEVTQEWFFSQTQKENEEAADLTRLKKRIIARREPMESYDYEKFAGAYDESYDVQFEEEEIFQNQDIRRSEAPVFSEGEVGKTVGQDPIAKDADAEEEVLISSQNELIEEDEAFAEAMYAEMERFRVREKTGSLVEEAVEAVENSEFVMQETAKVLDDQTCSFHEESVSTNKSYDGEEIVDENILQLGTTGNVHQLHMEVEPQDPDESLSQSVDFLHENGESVIQAEKSHTRLENIEPASTPSSSNSTVTNARSDSNPTITEAQTHTQKSSQTDDFDFDAVDSIGLTQQLTQHVPRKDNSVPSVQSMALHITEARLEAPNLPSQAEEEVSEPELLHLSNQSNDGCMHATSSVDLNHDASQKSTHSAGQEAEIGSQQQFDCATYNQPSSQATQNAVHSDDFNLDEVEPIGLTQYISQVGRPDHAIPTDRSESIACTQYNPQNLSDQPIHIPDDQPITSEITTMDDIFFAQTPMPTRASYSAIGTPFSENRYSDTPLGIFHGGLGEDDQLPPIPQDDNSPQTHIPRAPESICTPFAHWTKAMLRTECDKNGLKLGKSADMRMRLDRLWLRGIQRGAALISGDSIAPDAFVDAQASQNTSQSTKSSIKVSADQLMHVASFLLRTQTPRDSDTLSTVERLLLLEAVTPVEMQIAVRQLAAVAIARFAGDTNADEVLTQILPDGALGADSLNIFAVYKKCLEKLKNCSLAFIKAWMKTCCVTMKWQNAPQRVQEGAAHPNSSRR